MHEGVVPTWYLKYKRFALFTAQLQLVLPNSNKGFIAFHLGYLAGSSDLKGLVLNPTKRTKFDN